MKFCTAHQKGRRMPKGQSPVGRPSTFRGWRMDSKSQGTALWQRPKDNSSGTHSLINPSNSCSSLQDCIWLLGNSEDTFRGDLRGTLSVPFEKIRGSLEETNRFQPISTVRTESIDVKTLRTNVSNNVSSVSLSSAVVEAMD
ncbi:hypothetical protein V1477_015372 [Vespula maculifrons]|uniref:Uncharacterized protein n=2 Tax=Vespula TaxID=7451 RepID=A0A834JAF7_VESVU|nr:hypothetical protein HZH66_012749 [Vespula vulgaris]